MIHPAIHTGQTKAKGRGMFCNSPIEAQTIIEVAPVIVMSAEHKKLLDQTLLHDYIFDWTPGGEPLCCMALGHVPIYNHSYESNCEYFMNYEQQTMFVKTVRDIAQGEELTINYNGDWNDKRPVWFDAVL